MAVTAPELQHIAALLAAAATLREAAAAVRTQFPQLRASVVDALDVRDEKPAFSVGARRVYLVESDGHCWQLTRDPARVSGLLLADAEA